MRQLADGQVRLVGVPGSGSIQIGAGMKGSWLVFE